MMSLLSGCLCFELHEVVCANYVPVVSRATEMISLLSGCMYFEVHEVACANYVPVVSRAT